VADVLQNLSMVTDSIIVKVGDERAGEVRAVGTTSNPRLIHGTEPDLTFQAVRAKATLRKTAIAIEVIQGHLLA